MEFLFCPFDSVDYYSCGDREMKKYSMLSAGLSLILANLYGIFLAAYYKPLTLIMLTVSSLIIALIVWI
jgi:ABC-type bacteriocin/lantibiotic exporter with double-glycine peptidase domain